MTPSPSSPPPAPSPGPNPGPNPPNANAGANAVAAAPDTDADLHVDGIIYSFSGTRGIANEGLTPPFVLRLARAYGGWFHTPGIPARGPPGGGVADVIVGRDTRGSGPMIQASFVAGLLAEGINVVDVGVCPTPVIIHAQRDAGFLGGVIISGSHNPPCWNGIKFLGPECTFVDRADLATIARFFNALGERSGVSWREVGTVRPHDPIPAYRAAVLAELSGSDAGDPRDSAPPLEVVIDPGAGAATGVVDALLREMGARVTAIHARKAGPNAFPRAIEPKPENLGDLATRVVKTGAAVGFAFDCDADRVAVVGEDGTMFPEDVGLAIIVKDRLERLAHAGRTATIVTNVASSLMFDELARQHGARVVRTPVGERNLAIEMRALRHANAEKVGKPQGAGEAAPPFVFGGEGSCGGVMLPAVNNARDGILASLLIADILARSGQPLTRLAAALPAFHTAREVLQAESKRGKRAVRVLGDRLAREGLAISRVDHDVKLVRDDWWVLLHPSNTEPIVRVITEARTRVEAERLAHEWAQRLGVVLDET